MEEEATQPEEQMLETTPETTAAPQPTEEDASQVVVDVDPSDEDAAQAVPPPVEADVPEPGQPAE